MGVLKGHVDVKLVVDDESALYSPYSVEPEFAYPVKQHIMTKIQGADYYNTVRLTVISKEALDEDKFRAAVANWIHEKKVANRQKSKLTNQTLIGLLVIASLFIVLSLMLSDRIGVLSYTIVPVLGSVALGKAASMCIMEVPVNRATTRLIDEMERESPIIFERAEQEDRSKA